MKNKGFSLIELIVALAVFSLAVLSMTGIVLSVINSQRRAFVLQNTQEAGRFILETMSKEIKMSQIRSDDSAGSSEDTLSITNPEGDDIDYRFRIEGDKKKIQQRINGGEWQDLSPDNLEIFGGFYIVKQTFPNLAMVTITMHIKSKEVKPEAQSDIYLQTTVSSRSWAN